MLGVGIGGVASNALADIGLAGFRLESTRVVEEVRLRAINTSASVGQGIRVAFIGRRTTTADLRADGTLTRAPAVENRRFNLIDIGVVLGVELTLSSNEADTGRDGQKNSPSKHCGRVVCATESY